MCIGSSRLPLKPNTPSMYRSRFTKMESPDTHQLAQEPRPSWLYFWVLFSVFYRHLLLKRRDFRELTIENNLLWAPCTTTLEGGLDLERASESSREVRSGDRSESNGP